MIELDDITDLDDALFLTLGYVSSCWTNLSDAGEFESDNAKEAGNRLLYWIRKRYNLIENYTEESPPQEVRPST